MMAETDGLVLPVGLTEKQLLQQVARIESRMAKMETQTTQSFARANAKIAQSFKGLESSAAGMSNATKASLQNVGFQIQDIVVQIAGGQGAVRAFSQQLPQMLGGLGLAGVAAGTLAPLILAVGSALFSSTDDAKAAEEQMKALAAAITDLERASKATQQSTPDLIEQFGPEQVEQARKMLEIQRQLAKVNLARELSGAADLIGKAQFGDFAGKSADEWEQFGKQVAEARAEIEAMAQSEMDGSMTEDMHNRSMALTEFMATTQNYQQDLNKVQVMFGTTAENAGELVAAMIRLRDADGPEAQAQAAANLRDHLSEALGNMDGANEEARTLVEQLLKVEDAALRAAAADIAGNITPAANEAKRLADELARAVTNAINLGAQGISSLRQAQINYDFRDDPIRRAAALANLQFDEQVPIPATADDKIVARLERRRTAYVATAMATEEYRQRLIAWQKEEAKAAKSGSKKGTSTRANAYETALSNLEGNTDATEQQIAAIKSLSSAGGDLSKQLKIIAERQKILNAAQKAGVEVTPEMAAQIDKLVEEYVDANDELKDLQNNAKHGESALTDLFGSILDGSDAAISALVDLLAEIARVQFAKGALGLLGGTSWGSGLISLIGSGLTANAKGGVYDSPSLSAYSGSVVSSPTIFKFAKGGSLGLMGEAGSEAILPLSRMTNGELGVKAQMADSSPSTAHISIDVTGAKGNTEIQQMVAAGVSQGLSAYDKRLPSRVQQISNNPRKR